MIANSELLLDIMRLALTTAALTIPAISIAYFLITRSDEEERRRMSKVIGYGSISAIILVICALFTFLVLCWGFENEPIVIWISGGSFTIGCILLLYILLVLAGFKLKREIPMPRTEPQEPTQ